ncbi:MAG: sigma-70 family RNA polymerase sigma factor [Planctomycetes bacterium]|nr:sigma-70 family RNA polymerase sigma factor [Planctomycetota bacterium]
MGSTSDPLARLAHRCADQAWRLARVLTANDADADDIVQQAFVVAARKRDSIPADNLWPWFAKVIAFESRQLRRNRARHREVEMAQEPRSGGLEQQVERQELARLARAALAQLPDSEREAVALTHLTGLTLHAAAAAADVPVSTLDDRARRGIGRLRERLRTSETSLLGCLPMLPINPPPRGYAVSTDRWLSAAKASAAGAAATGGVLIMAKALAGLIVIALVIVAAVFFLRQPQRETPNRESVDAVASRGNSQDTAATKPINPSLPSGNQNVPSSPKADEAAPTHTKVPEEAVTPAPAPRTLSLSGTCMELTLATNADGYLDASLSKQPIAGAIIWAMRVSDEGGENSCQTWDPDAKMLCTTTAADGSWTIDNIPLEWPGPADAKGNTHKLIELRVTAYHPHYYRWDRLFGMVDDDDAAELYGEVPDGVRHKEENRFSHVGLTVKDDGKTTTLGQGQRTRMYFRNVNDDLLSFTTPVRLGLVKGASISGTVYDQDGKPACGAEVGVECWWRYWQHNDDWVDLDGFDTGMKFELTGICDKEGRYRIEGLHPWANTEIDVNYLGLHPLKTMFDPKGAGEEQALDFHLKAPARIFGRFMPVAGRDSAQGVIVTIEDKRNLLGEKRKVVLGDNGDFAFENLQAQQPYRLLVHDAEGTREVLKTDWLDLSNGERRVDLVEPAPSVLIVTLAQSAFADDNEKMAIVIAAAEWVEGQKSLSNLVTCMPGRCPTRADVARPNPSAELHFQRREIDPGTFSWPGGIAKRIVVVAIPVDFFTLNNHSTQRDALNRAMKRIYLSQPMEPQPGERIEVKLDAPMPHWTLDVVVKDGKKGRAYLEWIPVSEGDVSWRHGTHAQQLDTFGFAYFTQAGTFRVYWSKDNDSERILLGTVTMALGETKKLEYEAPAEPPK